MEPGILSKISASPSLVWVMAAIGFHVMNVFLGASMAFMKKTPSLYRMHRLLYFAILLSLAMFLVLNYNRGLLYHSHPFEQTLGCDDPRVFLHHRAHASARAHSSAIILDGGVAGWGREAGVRLNRRLFREKGGSRLRG